MRILRITSNKSPGAHSGIPEFNRPSGDGTFKVKKSRHQAAVHTRAGHSKMTVIAATLVDDGHLYSVFNGLFSISVFIFQGAFVSSRMLQIYLKVLF